MRSVKDPGRIRQQVETLIASAEKLVSGGDHETAVDTLEVALALDSASSRVRGLLESIRESLLEQPFAAEVERLLTQAESYLEQGQSGWAQAIAFQIYDLDPRNQTALALLERLDSESRSGLEPILLPDTGNAAPDLTPPPVLAKIDRLLARPTERPDLVSSPDEPESPSEVIREAQDQGSVRAEIEPEKPPTYPDTEQVLERGSEPESSDETSGLSETFDGLDESVSVDEPGASRRVWWWLLLAGGLLGGMILWLFARPEDLLSAGLSEVENGNLYSVSGSAAVDLYDRLYDRNPQDEATLQLAAAIAVAADSELELTLQRFRFDADAEIDFDRWHALCRISSRVDPQDADARFGEALTSAHVALETEDFPSALVALEELRGSFPLWDFLVFHAIGLAYGNSSSPYLSPVRAERFHQKALKGDPRFVRPLFEIADIRRDAGDLKGAEDYLRRALEIDRESPELLRRLGFVLSLQRAWDQARQAYRQSMKYETDDAKNRAVRRRLESLAVPGEGTEGNPP